MNSRAVCFLTWGQEGYIFMTEEQILKKLQRGE